MLGKTGPQGILFTAAIDLEQRTRADHPLRAIKRMVDEDLAKMSRRFDAAYADEAGAACCREAFNERRPIA